MCVGANTTCISGFEFFTVTDISSSIFFDDIVGGGLGLGLDLPDNGPSFVSTLFDQGVIPYN